MSVTPQNRMSAEITDKDLQSIKKSLAEIHKSMPFLIGLKGSDRKRLAKINSTNKIFVEDVIRTYDNIKAILPDYLSGAEMKKDLLLFEQLDGLEMQIAELHEKISCTRQLAGSEAYTAALTVYQLMKTASAAGVPGAAAHFTILQERFAKYGGKQKKQAEADKEKVA